MRKLIALVASTAALLVAGMGNAATVDLFLTQGNVGGVATNDWALTMNVNAAVDVAAVAFQITSSGTGSFVLGQSSVVIDPLTPGGLSNYVVAPGVIRVGTIYGSNGYAITVGAVSGFLIGTFTGTGPVALLPAHEGEGATIYDAAFGEPDFSLTTTPYVPVPEPGAMVLLGIGVGAVSLLRRKSA